MGQAGFVKDRDGSFTDGVGQRFQPEFTALAGATSERAQAIIVDTWRRAGFDVRSQVLPNAQVRDSQVRHTYSGVGWAVGGTEQVFASEQIGTPSNRWGGSNRGGWSNVEYDRLWDVYNTTLAPAERQEQLVRMAQLVNEELPIFILYFNYTIVAHTEQVTGPRSKTLWNVHEWSFRAGAS
jgi:ABC-type transport system substrate-binding protein